MGRPVRGAAVALAAGAALAAVAVVVVAAAPAVDRQVVRAELAVRLDRLREGRARPGATLATTGAPVPARIQRLGGLLASWQTVGGCGAGASTGSGGGVKWIGRGVTGGLFQVQCQSNYVHLDDGYTYAVSTLVTRDLTDRWTIGASLPWQYKYWRDPFGFGVDVSNEGIGDVNLLLTRRFGPINATSLTASLGLPTGGHKANLRGSVLRQDKQMGIGKYTGGLILDHTRDQLWGSVVVGGTLDWRGGQNELESYRAPASSAYGYVVYLLGPLAPAAGISLNGMLSRDRDQGRAQPTPLVTAAVNASVEWATDWFAVLAGGSVPFDHRGQVQPWIVALGVSVAPF